MDAKPLVRKKLIDQGDACVYAEPVLSNVFLFFFTLPLCVAGIQSDVTVGAVNVWLH